MGFTVEVAESRVLAIKAGKNNRTPVFVALDELLKRKGKDRIKDLKENVGRSLTAAQAKPVEAAATVEDLAAAFDGIVDERGSPRHVIASPGTPILQPTDERRRTGSHYTPRSLTQPIVAHALEPAFERLGPDATPEQILDLKVCDPAMGSGAFLVEACRAIATRLVKAWADWPEKRPVIPPDEDEDLHARRLVAQRCLYGVDRNARAVDLAKLSLWLATLAKDHEFTFLDHALKCGDSLVGLTPEQIAAANWDSSKPGLPLLRPLVAERVAEADRARAEIRSAPDDTMRAIQEQRHKHVETRLSPVRLLGDAVIAAFFSADKAKAREKARADAESWFSGRPARWDLLEASGNALRAGVQGIPPFHWVIEFPEVFKRENGGFDAIVGNPPFLGGRKISSEYGANYAAWLSEASPGSHGNADLVAHFFRHAFKLLRAGGALGLIATKTIGQGETRLSGLTIILEGQARISHAVRRLRWPGDAMVIVAVVHIVKTERLSSKPLLDGKAVSRISAYLVEGDLDASPHRLVANAGLAFQGSIPLGKGFIFDDSAHEKGLGPSTPMLEKVVLANRYSESRIFPYLGGDDINNHPAQAASRFIFDLENMPLSDARARFPELVEIAEEYVKPERVKQKREDLRNRWWQFAYRKNKLYDKIRSQTSVLVCSQATKFISFSRVTSAQIFDQKAIVVAAPPGPMDCVLNTRAHWLWVETFASTLGETLNYSTGACFETFPFPVKSGHIEELATKGEAFLSQRLSLMSGSGEGLTKTYNRFHDRFEKAPDIARLRERHADMDDAVLRAYGWDDLADCAQPEFVEQDADEGKQAKTRLDWPSEFKDEVLARLLALNAERAEAERAAGLTASEEDDENPDDDGEDE
ncbi:N-6 DNA methylase [Cereibacter ovatus]|uniref:site-specific DNA-methyltransferase (adenine-specific) n=1 Tax=Cereibacter ovatus TaxID=439529 RepID=A0A285D1V3_9RHOB|nr:DNA methyltransferase [Cereibacter ovatus]SNX73163.1 N-6 DNA methylase [Cereibacter ovatus]